MNQKEKRKFEKEFKIEDKKKKKVKHSKGFYVTLWASMIFLLVAGFAVASNYISSSGTSTLQGTWDFENGGGSYSKCNWKL